MKSFINQAAQGDLLITRIDAIPDDAQKVTPEGNCYVVAHSETGHNHVIQQEGVDVFSAANDPFVLYLVVDTEAEIKHLRGFDTHESLRVTPGIYRINRQREYVPEGFRRAAD